MNHPHCQRRKKTKAKRQQQRQQQRSQLGIERMFYIHIHTTYSLNTHDTVNLIGLDDKK